VAQDAAGAAPAPAFAVHRRLTGVTTDPLRKASPALQPRKPYPRQPLHLPAGARHEITVKFMDAAQARPTGTQQLSVSAASEEEFKGLNRLVQEHGLQFEALFPCPERIEGLRGRAARRSGRMQPDLNGWMRVRVAVQSDLLAIARALQALPLVESVELECLDSPPPPPADIPPTTPSLVHYQTYRGLNPGFGIDFIPNLGITGSGVRLSDCEYGYNAAHEDLVDSPITNESRAPFHTAVFTNNWDEHGTAVMGIIAAGNNGYGVTGMAPDCSVHFYSEYTTLGYNRSAAISDAVADSAEGDVVLLEMQASGPGGGSKYVPAEYNSTVWGLTRTATDAGVIVVAAAGNGNQDLDDPLYDAYMARGDSGAIIVGSGSANTSHTKSSFSTHGSRVDVQAWGSSVASTGYGALAKYGGDDNQTYTSSFGGTSSASACTAGVVVLLQSYARNVLKTTFTPAEMRSHLKAFGHAQGGAGGNIGPAVALDLALPALPDRSLSLAVKPSGGQDVELQLWGLPFRTYTIKAGTNLDSWTDAFTGVSGGASPATLLLPGEMTAYPSRFYMVLQD